MDAGPEYSHDLGSTQSPKALRRGLDDPGHETAPAGMHRSNQAFGSGQRHRAAVGREYGHGYIRIDRYQGIGCTHVATAFESFG